MLRVARLSLAVPLIFVAACPTPPPSAPGTSPDPSATAPRASPPVTYEHTCGTKHLKLDRSCSADSDCGYVEAPQCCGYRDIFGVRASEAKRVAAECGEFVCQLGCPFGGFRAEDGNTIGQLDEIGLKCTQGKCTTRHNNAGCCEEGLSWSGCCPTPGNPTSHRCGDPAGCRIACMNQGPCK